MYADVCVKETVPNKNLKSGNKLFIINARNLQFYLINPLRRPPIAKDIATFQEEIIFPKLKNFSFPKYIFKLIFIYLPIQPNPTHKVCNFKKSTRRLKGSAGEYQPPV